MYIDSGRDPWKLGEKIFRSGEGKGIRGGGGGGREKNWGKKTEGKEKRGEKKKTMETGRIEPSSRAHIDRETFAQYPLPTGTLQLHCEQFWTFIVYANAHTQAELL